MAVLLPPASTPLNLVVYLLFIPSACVEKYVRRDPATTRGGDFRTKRYVCAHTAEGGGGRGDCYTKKWDVNATDNDHVHRYFLLRSTREHTHYTPTTQTHIYLKE